MGSGWAGADFFIAAHLLLCFGFVTECVDNTLEFQLWLSSPCTASSLDLFPALLLPGGGWSGGKDTGGPTVRLAFGSAHPT